MADDKNSKSKGQNWSTSKSSGRNYGPYVFFGKTSEFKGGKRSMGGSHSTSSSSTTSSAVTVSTSNARGSIWSQSLNWGATRNQDEEDDKG